MVAEWLGDVADSLLSLPFLWRCNWPIILSVGLIAVALFALSSILFLRNGREYKNV
ncbi:MAG: hypothetical protein PHY72_00675 [Candidatus Pacebacteria bacterium]|nr:hypothetical protein [Candidatus Paceibacterota bacterium]